jgi:hypothetical protein
MWSAVLGRAGGPLSTGRATRGHCACGPQDRGGRTRVTTTTRRGDERPSSGVWLDRIHCSGDLHGRSWTTTRWAGGAAAEIGARATNATRASSVVLYSRTPPGSGQSPSRLPSARGSSASAAPWLDAAGLITNGGSPSIPFCSPRTKYGSFRIAMCSARRSASSGVGSTVLSAGLTRNHSRLHLDAKGRPVRGPPRRRRQHSRRRCPRA